MSEVGQGARAAQSQSHGMTGVCVCVCKQKQAVHTNSSRSHFGPLGGVALCPSHIRWLFLKQVSTVTRLEKLLCLWNCGVSQSKN